MVLCERLVFTLSAICACSLTKRWDKARPRPARLMASAKFAALMALLVGVCACAGMLEEATTVATKVATTVPTEVLKIATGRAVASVRALMLAVVVVLMRIGFPS